MTVTNGKSEDTKNQKEWLTWLTSLLGCKTWVVKTVTKKRRRAGVARSIIILLLSSSFWMKQTIQQHHRITTDSSQADKQVIRAPFFLLLVLFSLLRTFPFTVISIIQGLTIYFIPQKNHKSALAKENKK